MNKPQQYNALWLRPALYACLQWCRAADHFSNTAKALLFRVEKSCLASKAENRGTGPAVETRKISYRPAQRYVGADTPPRQLWSPMRPLLRTVAAAVLPVAVCAQTAPFVQQAAREVARGGRNKRRLVLTCPGSGLYRRPLDLRTKATSCYPPSLSTQNEGVEGAKRQEAASWAVRGKHTLQPMSLASLAEAERN
jgi:hypothetical protein